MHNASINTMQIENNKMIIFQTMTPENNIKKFQETLNFKEILLPERNNYIKRLEVREHLMTSKKFKKRKEENK